MNSSVNRAEAPSVTANDNALAQMLLQIREAGKQIIQSSVDRSQLKVAVAQMTEDDLVDLILLNKTRVADLEREINGKASFNKEAFDKLQSENVELRRQNEAAGLLIRTISQTITAHALTHNIRLDNATPRKIESVTASSPSITASDSLRASHFLASIGSPPPNPSFSLGMPAPHIPRNIPARNSSNMVTSTQVGYNAKGAVKEFFDQARLQMPGCSFKLSGPPHQTVFDATIIAAYKGVTLKTAGQGMTKAAAEQDAYATLHAELVAMQGPKDGGYGGYNPYGNGQTAAITAGCWTSNWTNPPGFNCVQDSFRSSAIFNVSPDTAVSLDLDIEHTVYDTTYGFIVPAMFYWAIVPSSSTGPPNLFPVGSYVPFGTEMTMFRSSSLTTITAGTSVNIWPASLKAGITGFPITYQGYFPSTTGGTSYWRSQRNFTVHVDIPFSTTSSTLWFAFMSTPSTTSNGIVSVSWELNYTPTLGSLTAPLHTQTLVTNPSTNPVLTNVTNVETDAVPVYEIRSPFDPLPVAVMNANVNPVPVIITNSVPLELETPVWVTEVRPETTSAPKPKSGAKDGGLGGFNPYGNGQTSPFDDFEQYGSVDLSMGVSPKLTVVESFQPIPVVKTSITTNTPPVSDIEDDQVKPRRRVKGKPQYRPKVDIKLDLLAAPLIDADETKKAEDLVYSSTDDWLDNHLRNVPKYIFWYKSILTGQRVNSHLPERDEDEMTSMSAPKVEAINMPSEKGGAAKGNDRKGSSGKGRDKKDEEKKNPDESLSRQRSAEQRIVGSLRHVNDFHDWVVTRKPTLKWALHIFRLTHFEPIRSASNWKAREIFSHLTLTEQLDTCKTYAARLLFEPYNLPRSIVTSWLTDNLLSVEEYFDQTGYAEWLARVRNSEQHALNGNTTKYWDSGKVADIIKKKIVAQTSIPITDMSQQFGLGFVPVAANISLLSGQTYLQYRRINAANAILGLISTMPFTTIGVPRDMRADGNQPLAPSDQPLAFAPARLIAGPEEDLTIDPAYDQIIKNAYVSRAQASTFLATSRFPPDIFEAGMMCTSRTSTSMCSFFFRAHAYKSVCRFDNDTVPGWNPRYEYVSRNSVIVDNPPALLWGGSPAFDENCNIAAGQQPLTVGPAAGLFSINLTEGSVQENTTRLAVPLELLNSFSEAPGLALAMLLCCVSQWPLFMPVIAVDSTDPIGNNPGQEHYVPNIALSYIPATISGSISMLWPVRPGSLLAQMGGPGVQVATVHPPRYGAFVTNVPANNPILTRMVGDAPGVGNQSIASFIVSWIDQMTESTWLRFINVFEFLFKANHWSGLALSYVCQLSHGARITGDAPIGVGVAYVPAGFTSETLDWLGRRKIIGPGNGFIPGGICGAPLQNLAPHWSMFDFRVEYFNAICMIAYLPASPQFVFSLKISPGPFGYLQERTVAAKLVAAGQAIHHNIRLAVSVLNNPYAVSTPLPVASFLSKLFVTNQAIVSAYSLNLHNLVVALTGLQMSVANVPGPITAMTSASGFWAPAQADDTIPSYVPNVWMQSLLGPSIEWTPMDMANTLFQGKSEGTWYKLGANLQIWPCLASQRDSIVGVNTWPTVSRDKIGNDRILLESVGANTVVMQLSGVGQHATVLARSVGTRLAPQVAWENNTYWNTISYSIACYSGPAGQAPLYIYLGDTMPEADIGRKQSLLVGNLPIALPTVMLGLTAQPAALFNDSGNKAMPEGFGVMEEAETKN